MHAEFDIQYMKQTVGAQRDELERARQAIDDAVRHGLGLRWSFMGPFETIDLNAHERGEISGEELLGRVAASAVRPGR